MSILKFLEFIKETKLTLGELEKPIGDKLRGDVLIKKLKNKEPLSTNKGDNIIDKIKDDDEWVEIEDGIDNLIDDNGNYDSRKAKSYFTHKNKYINTFKDLNDDEYKLNQIDKTTEFGSKGPGRLTRKTESLQCIFLAIKQNNPNIILHYNNMFKLYEKAIEDGYLNDVVYLQNTKIDSNLIGEFSIDENWSYTFSEIANKLWNFSDENRQKLINRNIKYKIFHVGYSGENSPYINIYKKYKEFSAIDGYREINIAKYCPSDVYMVDESNVDSINNMILKTKNIVDLTTLLDELFDNRQLISISLKKIMKSSEFKIIINKEIGKELPFFFINGYVVGSNLKGIGSKIETTSIWKHKLNKDVDIKKRVINFDSSDTSKLLNIDGEVEGSSSKHGKISFGWIKKILSSSCEKLNIDNIQEYVYFKNSNIEELRDLTLDLINKIELIKKGNPDKNINIREIRGTDISNSKYRLISRIQSLQVIYTILQISLVDNDESNAIITKILRYALSIQTDFFDTPRYLRVI